MKRKLKILCAVLCIAILVISFCACNNADSPNNSQSSVNVPPIDDNQNGGEEQFLYDIYKTGDVVVLKTEKFECEKSTRCLKVPVVSVLSALGAEIEWESENVAAIKYGGKMYTLNTEHGTMIEQDEEYSLFDIIPPGGGTTCKHIEGTGERFCIDYKTFENSLLVSYIEKWITNLDDDKIFFVPESIDEGCNLNVNGMNFKNASIVTEDSSVITLSLNDILTGCGFSIEWSGAVEAVASKNGREYLINYSEHTFYEKGTEKNLLENTADRENYRCNYIFENGKVKLLVDFETLNDLMRKIDAPIYMVKKYFTSPYPIYVWSDYGK